MSPERAASNRRKGPAPAITLSALQDIGDQVIAAGAYWFQGGYRRVDQLLDQFDDERLSRLAWERSADDSYSIAMARAYDRDSDQVVPVAVVGIPCFRALTGGSARLDQQEQSQEGAVGP